LLARDAFVFKGDKDIMSKVPMTVVGADQLRKELELLKFDRRPKITEAIASARELGDLKENAEYHAAREDQGICEARIRDIEGKLSNAQIIDVTKLENTGRVIFGTTVTILNIDTDAKMTYRIVGDDEADIKQNLISVNSPIARGLIGKSEGAEVSITTPGGLTDYEIMSVKYL
jgi:transcription elongation factor GreA